ncbi:MAG TPA: glycosyltransferase 87 family protein, partial [Thermomicrobiales bacterium]
AFAVAFVLYLVAAARIVGMTAGRGALALILGLALVPRLILLGSTPALSDDLYRYIWDGKVAAAGIDPYRYAPDAPELAPLRDHLWPPINQKSQHTPYPPAAQAVFALTYRIAPDSVKAQQVVATLADLLVIGALLLLLGRLGLPRERVLLYAWSPTPTLHFAHSAHNDALMIAGVLLALALVVGPGGMVASRRVASGVALAVAVLVKLVPLLLALPLLRRWRLAGGLACALTLVIGVAPFAASGDAALAGLGTEAGESVFNDSLHFVLVRVFGLFTGRPSVASGLFSAALLGLTTLWLTWRGGDDLALVRGAATLLALAILLNAVVEPWYLAWLLPFIAILLQPGAGRWPFAVTPLLGWLWVSGAIQLTDLTYLDPANARWWPLIRLIEYGPLLAILSVTLLVAARRRIGGSPIIPA